MGRVIDQFEVKSELRDYMSEHARGIPFWLKEALESWVLSVDLGYKTMVFYDESQNRIERPTNVMTLLELTKMHTAFERYNEWLYDQKVKWKN
jgi:hypothetical protein